MLINHIEEQHGQYYLKLDGRANIRKICRICNKTFVVSAVFEKHLMEAHPREAFARESGTDSDDTEDKNQVAGKSSKYLAESVVSDEGRNESKKNKVKFMDRWKEDTEKKREEAEQRYEVG